MKSFVIENCKKYTNLSSYIFNKFPNLPKSVFFKALRNKDIKVNEKRINKDVNLSIGDNIKLYISDSFLFSLPQKIDYIYEDENIAIVFKPQGLLSNNESQKILEPTLDDLVKKEHPNFIICHRLDRNTAGLVIFAKNTKAYNAILLGFKENCIEKEYIAYVSGANFKVNKDTLEQYMLLDKKTGFSKVYNSNKEDIKVKLKKVTTSYQVLYNNKKDDFSILKIKIHNGKTHQIRAVMANISHPIIGDSKYGKNEINKKFNKYKQLLFAVRYIFDFSDYSFLNYLNQKEVILEDIFYKKYIGEIYEKIT